jgi:hypothetical protein
MIFQSPKRGRRNSPLGDDGICPLVALEGGTRKPNSRADAGAVKNTRLGHDYKGNSRVIDSSIKEK